MFIGPILRPAVEHARRLIKSLIVRLLAIWLPYVNPNAVRSADIHSAEHGNTLIIRLHILSTDKLGEQFAESATQYRYHAVHSERPRRISLSIWTDEPR